MQTIGSVRVNEGEEDEIKAGSGSQGSETGMVKNGRRDGWRWGEGQWERGAAGSDRE